MANPQTQEPLSRDYGWALWGEGTTTRTAGSASVTLCARQQAQAPLVSDGVPGLSLPRQRTPAMQSRNRRNGRMMRPSAGWDS